MEISFRKSATKIYLEKSLLPKNDREFLLDCAKKVFSVFSVHCDYLRHNGDRFYLQGNFHDFLFNPLESVSYNIFMAGHLITFKEDNRFGVTVFGQQCFVHPDDLLLIDAVFAPHLGVNVDSKSIGRTLVELSCQIVNNLRSGRMTVTVNFEGSKPSNSQSLKRLLCVISHGGVVTNGEQVISIFLFKFLI